MSGKQKSKAGKDLFVSYAGPDRAWAEWAAWHLQAAGYSVILNAWEWDNGDNFVLGMSDSLDQANRVLTLWSPAYFDRDRFTTEEWTSAVAARQRMVAVRVADVDPPAVLQPVLYTDVFGLDEEPATAALLRAVQGPKGPDGKPEFPGTAKRKRPKESAPRLPGVQPDVWNVPHRNTAFTGRAASLAEIRQQLSRGGSTVIQALYGFGGIGKTTLAIEYAYRFAGSYTLVWWINAEQPALIGEQFTILGTAAGWISADVPTSNPTALVRQRLRVEPGWLLIFDNAERRDDLLPWLPQGGGHVLITSRNPSWNEAAHPVPVPEFTRAESIALLRARLPALTQDRADQLADHLGDLPLALAQAAEMLGDSGMTVADYLDLLDKETVEILSEGTPASYPVPLAAVVRTSVQRLTERDPAAADLLQWCAFLAPEPIPTDLFTGPSKLALARRTQLIGGYGLAKIGDGTLQLHRLTQAILRDAAVPDARNELRETLRALVVADGLDDGRNPLLWPRWAALLPHIFALDPVMSGSFEFRQVACHASSYLIARGDMRTGRDFADHLHTGWAQQLGPDDPQALFSATNVALADRELGKFVAAHRLDEQLYRRRRNLLGDDHPDTLVSALNLTVSLGILGQSENALQLGQDTYARHRARLGEDHFDTLTAAVNLASSLRGVGRYAEALTLDRDSQARLRRTIGDDHPDTLISAYQTAIALDSLGEYDEALSLLQATYTAERRVLGDDHPDTLKSLLHVGFLLSNLGRLREALPFQQDSYDRHRRVLGNSHPQTARAAESLAWTLRRLNRSYDAHRLERWIKQHRAVEAELG